MDRLFVYGTLKRGAGNPFRDQLASASTFIVEASFQGRMYRIDALEEAMCYPAVVPSSLERDRVHGELLRLHQPEAMLALLDEYEDATTEPDPSFMYRRVEAPVLRADGEIERAFVYLYNQPVAPLAPIPSGVFDLRDAGG